MNRLLSITTAAALALTAQNALAAPIDYSFELDAFFSIGSLSTLTPVSIVISGSGDTDNIFSIDGQNVKNMILNASYEEPFDNHSELLASSQEGSARKRIVSPSAN
jgi:hypothetical protein